MDRLTTCRPDGRIETTGISYSEVHMDYVPSARINDHYDMRLAQYEDTGLTPEEITQLRAELEQERVKVMEEALDKLARLGAEPRYGNSIGNRIAQQVLKVGDFYGENNGPDQGRDPEGN